MMDTLQDVLSGLSIMALIIGVGMWAMVFA